MAARRMLDGEKTSHTGDKIQIESISMSSILLYQCLQIDL